jgi:hypothetical protein
VVRNLSSVPPSYVDGTRLWVDSRLRALVQRREAAILRRLGGAVPGGTVLELGTGRRGTGLRLAVLTGEVGQAADGWVAADPGVGPMVVVGV